ncbi:xanthine dehydrogenase accessory protein XdhC [Ramlibacter sp. Leaf400]|uniref:xanthine dehydrogenase accessory protein XdhC n=1 Tax=Ramlibacter sp. Leaf400 TaxID=1736365 RepID=UPI0006F82A38|nr:xanthine dehydrogenase accessory protein XdhC [Ramlibacter sp. Leaf400]KQT14320.1 xanthine dehydrogenase [Ramlibacter sp. Leaf400]
MNEWSDTLAQQGQAVLVTVASVEGSGPREPGAWMLVFERGEAGTIGGGRLEFDATTEARELLSAGPGARPLQRRYALGPSLGQCCGGVVHLAFERVTANDVASLKVRLAEPATPVALFGGGHVGRAIAQRIGGLPFELTWIDSRDEIFPEQVPANVRCEYSDPVQRAVADLAPGSLVLIMSFSHAEDLDILAACLQRRRERQDLPFVGLIGSKTKWATFRHRLEQRGFTGPELDAVHCPIGVPGLAGKQPAVVAVSALAQLLQAAPPRA